MGVYDEYGQHCVQLKVGDCTMHHYEEGEASNIPDGLYVGWGGFVVIDKGIVAKSYPGAVTSHGGFIEADEIMHLYNPFTTLAEKLRDLERAEGECQDG